jgi:HEAT repeat protein
MPLLKDPDHSVRSRAALAAASVSPGSEDVAMTLVHMLKHDPNIWVREEVASALGTIQAAASEVKDVLESTARLREPAPAVTEHTEHTDFSEVMLRIAAAFFGGQQCVAEKSVKSPGE